MGQLKHLSELDTLSEGRRTPRVELHPALRPGGRRSHQDPGPQPPQITRHLRNHDVQADGPLHPQDPHEAQGVQDDALLPGADLCEAQRELLLE